MCETLTWGVKELLPGAGKAQSCLGTESSKPTRLCTAHATAPHYRLSKEVLHANLLTKPWAPIQTFRVDAIGEILKGSLLKGSFDKACTLTCRFLCRSPPQPAPSPPPSTFPPTPSQPFPTPPNPSPDPLQPPLSNPPKPKLQKPRVRNPINVL